MGSLGPTALIAALLAVAIVAAISGFIASVLARRNKRRARGIFVVGFACGLMAGTVLRRRRWLNILRLDVLPALKMRGFPVPASCLVAHAANAVGWLVVEVRADRLCRFTAWRALMRATDLRDGGCLRPRRLNGTARPDLGNPSTS